MEKQFPRVFAKVVRHNHGLDSRHSSSMWLRIPVGIYNSGDPTAVHQYVGEELNWHWMMSGAVVACYTPEHVESLMEDVR